jgi:hypothetical protein
VPHLRFKVINRGEYPVLAERPRSYASATTVYAAGDPRAALNRAKPLS